MNQSGQGRSKLAAEEKSYQASLPSSSPQLTHISKRGVGLKKGPLRTSSLSTNELNPHFFFSEQFQREASLKMLSKPHRPPPDHPDVVRVDFCHQLTFQPPILHRPCGKALKYYAMQCNAVQCNAVQCNIILGNAMQCNARSSNVMQRNPILLQAGPV